MATGAKNYGFISMVMVILALIPFLMLTIGIGEILSIGVCGNLLLETLMPYRKLLFPGDKTTPPSGTN